MSFVRNMLILKHVYHLSTDMESKKTYNMPKCTPIDTNQINPTKYLMDGKEKR